MISMSNTTTSISMKYDAFGNRVSKAVTNTSGTTPSASISTTNGFGEISKTAGNSRQIQFSLKLIY